LEFPKIDGARRRLMGPVKGGENGKRGMRKELRIDNEVGPQGRRKNSHKKKRGKLYSKEEEMSVLIGRKRVKEKISGRKSLHIQRWCPSKGNQTDLTKGKGRF